MAKNASKLKRQKASSGKQRNTSAVLPLIFGMSPEHAARLKRIPHDSLVNFQAKQGTKLDSTNIYLRLMTGMHIVERVIKTHNIDGEVFAPLQNALSAMRSIMFRNDGVPQTKWHMSPGEYVLVQEGLDVVDQLQDQITRREMLMAFRESQKVIEGNFRKENPGVPVPKELKDQIV